MRVLITGARGQVGQSLRDRIPDDWEVIFTDSKTLDITNKATVNSMIAGFQPNVVINTAAYTDVIGAEENALAAFQVNAEGIKNLAQATQAIQAKLIHISTDFVFDGNSNTPYGVEDAPSPINTYGKSKLAGELLALSLCRNTRIVRTSSVYSEYGNNFVKKIIVASQHSDSLDVTNALTKPTYAGDLANFIIEMITHDTQEALVHFTGPDTLSWADFAQAIVKHSSNNMQINAVVSNDAVYPRQTLLATTEPNCGLGLSMNLPHVISNL